MKALEHFTITLDKAIKDSVVLDSGLELFIDNKFKEFEHRKTEAIINSTPLRYETKARKGDTLYFHHLVVIGEGQRFPGEKNLYMVKYDTTHALNNQAIAYKSAETNQIHPLWGWCLLSPIEQDKKDEEEPLIKIAGAKEKLPTKAKVVVPCEGLEEMGVQVGDTVGFKENMDYRITIDGEEYYRVALTELLYKEV